MGCPSRFREKRSRLLGLAACLALCGCGGPKRHPVSGTVFLDDRPVAGAAVLFTPTAGGPPAHGITDADGRFTLESANKPGVLRGEYTVTVSKQRTTGVGADEKAGPGGVRIEYLVPQRYGDPKTSGLTARVPSDQYEFRLTTK